MRSLPFIRQTYHSVLVLFLLGLFLTTGIPAALPELPTLNLVAQTLSASQLVEQGRKFYSQRNFNQAAVAWQQAAQAYEKQGDRLHQAMALSYLCLAYQRLEEWSDAQAAIQTSLNLLNRDMGNSPDYTQIYAQVLNTRGRLELTLGQAEAALKTWQLATKTYDEAGDETGVTGSLINQAQAMEVLGLYRRTCKTLLNALQLDNNCDLSEQQRFETVLQAFEKQPDTQIKIIGLRSLGNILRLIGDLDNSQQVLEQGLAVVQQTQSPLEESATLLSLGKTERARYSQAKDLYNRTNLPIEKARAKQAAQLSINRALSYYQQAANKTANLSSSKFINIQSKLHQLSLLIEYQQWLQGLTDESPSAEVQKLASQIKSQVADLRDSEITALPPTQTTVYAQLNFAQSLIQLKQNDEFITLASNYANNALQKAKKLKDLRAESQALGTLGNLYEQTQQWSLAHSYTEQALILVQGIQAWDIVYQWQWQLGRIYQAQGEMKKAIAAYEVAIKTLESVRDDLLAIDSDARFSFRENIEPIYRKLVALLLPNGNTNPPPENLHKSLYYVEALQLAELENFLDCNLKNTQKVQTGPVNNLVEPTEVLINRINQVVQEAPTTALIYPIILEQQLAVILKLPGQSLRYHTSTISRSEVETTVDQLQQYLRDPSRTNDVKKLSSQVYDWLIKPFEAELEMAVDLEQSNLKTLVFVLDGSLGNIPMAVLYDEERDRYLLQRYAVAVTSGLQLLDSDPLPRQIEALVAGLSEQRQFGGQTFAPLANVPDELQAIESVVPSKKLLNDTFTHTSLQEEINSGSLSVVHMATHGKFSSNPEETFVILWDERLNLDSLDNLLRTNEPNRTKTIELLVLSACETAVGDKRAALGLAGVALQAGARSTLATLWQVDDESTASLMSQFYHQLQENKHITKAEALRRVQLELGNNQSKDWEVPFFWAPYVLVGNWI
ncbi:MAG: CHAT domain-containing protein [Symploca sp. SIO1A3]|nr:CHAT domain-containing protein [Symploca sp. SIO1A3]